MATVKQYRRPGIVSGMTIPQITSMSMEQLNSLNKADLREIVGRMVSAGNKRLDSFAKAGRKSPSVGYIERHGGRFSTRGKSVNQLRAEFARAKGFLTSETGDVRSWRKIMDQARATMKDRYGLDVNQDTFEAMWEAYDKLRELDPKAKSAALKYGALRDIAAAMQDGKKTPEEIAIEISAKLSEAYEKSAAQSGVSSFFNQMPTEE